MLQYVSCQELFLDYLHLKLTSNELRLIVNSQSPIGSTRVARRSIEGFTNLPYFTCIQVHGASRPEIWVLP